MTTVQESVDIAVPVAEAYDEWTRFEEFSSLLEDARITEQDSGHRIAWTSTSGTENGSVSFDRLDDLHTRVTVEIEHGREGAIASIGAALGVDDRRLRHDLERFRNELETTAEPSAPRGGGVHRRMTAEGSEIDDGPLPHLTAEGSELERPTPAAEPSPGDLRETRPPLV